MAHEEDKARQLREAKELSQMLGDVVASASADSTVRTLGALFLVRAMFAGLAAQGADDKHLSGLTKTFEMATRDGIQQGREVRSGKIPIEGVTIIQ